jgi:uncharacterized protein (DUF58 family)
MEGFLERIDPIDSRQFRVAIKKLADSLSYGTDRSRFLGAGIEYAQSRPYSAGDAVRTIDWRVTARTRRFHVKEFESPKRMPCWLLIDTSASMTVSSVARSKYELALQIAGGIAYACLDRVSPVGLVGVGERIVRQEPSLSKSEILRWLLELRRYRFDERTTLARRIGELTPSLSHRVFFVVLSDLHDEGALVSLRHLATLHDCAVVELRDPAEEGLRGAGFLRAREAETGAGFDTHGRRRWLDPRVTADLLRKSGIDHLVIRTDQPFIDRLRRFFGARALLGRGAR